MHIAFVVNRMWQSVIVILIVSFIAFFIVRLSGDPVALMLPQEATLEDIARVRSQYGFDKPIYEQYFNFLQNVARGEFGQSLRYHQPALLLVLERMPATLELAFSATLVSLLVSIPLGIIGATRRNSVWDHLATFGALVGQSMPVYWLGIMLILVFAVHFQLLPTSGHGTIQQLALPTIALSTALMARLTRMVRAGLLDVLGQDYIRTARSKGLIERVVLYRHALKNCLIPVITVIGWQFGTLLGGSVVTEVVFAWPGMGRLAAQAITARDYPVVQAVILVISLLFISINFLVDIVYTYVDPRIRFS